MDAQTAAAAWGFTPQTYLCQHCDARFIRPQEDAPPVDCPRCHAPALQPAEIESIPLLAAPELVQPFQVAPGVAASQVQAFTNGLPYPPADLNPHTLQARLQALYLPVWLVDVWATAEWKAEAGFYYQVVSHQERFDGGGWRTRQVEEQRTRWEPRLGNLSRSYPNRPAPALEDHARLAPLLGPPAPSQAQPYHPRQPLQAMVRLPDRPSADAWPDVQPSLQQTAADECRLACQADQIRAFAWSPAFSNLNWTLLLQPVYTSYYIDDDQRRQPVWIDGKSGRITGVRRASMQAAQRSALIILAVGVLLFVLGGGLALASVVAPPTAILGGLSMAAGVIVALAAVIPLIRVWRFNQSTS